MSPKKLLLCVVTVVSLCGLYWQKGFLITANEMLKYKNLEHSTTGNETRLLRCPKRSPLLVGAIRENLQTKTLDEVEMSLTNSKALEESYSSMGPAGHYYPSHCIARQKVAVLIPFRNRHHHLPILLNNLVPILRRQLTDFRIYVIEQESGVTFNKGLLFNVGFITALSKEKFHCLVLQDVDCLPLNDNILYRCGDNPIHLSAYGSKWNYSLPYHQFVGGALMMSRSQYINVNGFSNLYFGWGSEDDDFQTRILNRGYKILRYPKSIARFYNIRHERDEGNAENSVRHRLFWSAKRRIVTEGLRTSVYKIRSIEEKPLFVWIRVSVNMTKVLQTAPSDLKRVLKVLLNDGRKFDKLGLGHSEEGDTFKLPSENF